MVGGAGREVVPAVDTGDVPAGAEDRAADEERDPRVHPATADAAAAAARPSTARRLTVMSASCLLVAETAQGAARPARPAERPARTQRVLSRRADTVRCVRDNDPEPTRWWVRPGSVLAGVALVHAALPLVLLGRHWAIGIDESVYLSQLNAHVPPGSFSAPRARGSTFVAAPVTLLTTSVAVMRIWTSLLSGLGLFLAYRPWLTLRPGYVVPLAAGLFASIWSVTYYGFEPMPNEWLAFAVVGACGCLLRYLLGRRWTSLAGAAVAMAVAALFRPSDAAFACLALVLVCVFARVPWRRRLIAVAALGAGTFAGALEWIVEAYTSFGGLGARIHAAVAEQGGSGLHFSLGAQARALAGPLLCRTGCHADAAVAYRLWWLGAAALVVAAVVRARRQQGLLDLAPVALGVALVAEYVFTVGYAAPRFLIPAYAALALPASSGLVIIVRSVSALRPRVTLAGAFTVLFAAHLVLQLYVITAHEGPAGRRAAAQTARSETLLRRAGVRGRCLMIGQSGNNGALAYDLRCSNRNPGPRALRADLHDSTRVVWLTDTPPSPGWGVRWQRLRLPWRSGTTAYVGPAP